MLCFWGMLSLLLSLLMVSHCVVGDRQLTEAGGVLVKNLRNLGDEPVALQLGDGPVNGLHVLPNNVSTAGSSYWTI
jgi:hypothetical protein